MFCIHKQANKFLPLYRLRFLLHLKIITMPKDIDCFHGSQSCRIDSFRINATLVVDDHIGSASTQRQESYRVRAETIFLMKIEIADLCDKNRNFINGCQLHACQFHTFKRMSVSGQFFNHQTFRNSFPLPK